MKTTDSSRPNDGAIIVLPQFTVCPCEARPGWPYLRFTREGRFLAVLEELTDDPARDRALFAGMNGIFQRAGWRRLNLSAHAEWLVYQHGDFGATEIWKYPEAERLHHGFRFEQDVTCAEFRPDGAQLACLLGRDVPGIWCWEGQWHPRRLGEGHRVFSFLSYSADSCFLAAASDDRRIHLWDAQTLEIVAISPPQDAIAGLSLNEKGTWFAAGAGKEVRIWESGGGLLRSLPAGEPVWRVFFSPKGDLLAVVHDEGVQMWDARTGERLGAFSFPVEHAYFQMAFRPDGTMAAWGNSSRACAGPLFSQPLGFYDLKSGGVITNMHEAPIAAGWAFK